MRIALCQLNPTVGDLAGNRTKILRDAERAARAGAELAVFPELTLVGYPPKDLLDRPSFVRAVNAALLALAAELPPTLPCVVGFVESAPSETRPSLFNSVALLHEGYVKAVARKRLLPTYDVFDDQRYFAAGDSSLLLEIAGRRVGITICEDIWADQGVLRVKRYAANPVRDLMAQGAEVLINLAASPFTLNKRMGREALLAEVARENRVPLVFVNQVGGNDDVLFDGQSSVFNPKGELIARAPAFEEAFVLASLKEGGSIAEIAVSDEAAALDALSMGTRDYVRKTGFKSVLLGLSGGIDSALVAAIAVRALGAENVLGVLLPTRYSSDHSLRDAEELARQLGIRFHTIPIEPLFESYMRELPQHLEQFGEATSGDVTFENIQARIRGNVLMALSNRTGALLLTTGNKSEVAVGYCTLYGDMAGALAVIADVPKTFVYALSRELNRQAGRSVIPESTLTKPPSAELRPGQTDQDSLPPYEVLDRILEQHIEAQASEAEIVALGFDAEVVRRVLHLVRISEYKRKQMALGLILTHKAFGIGRRYPIAQRAPA